MSVLSVIFSVLLLSKTIKSHTVEVCNVVSADGTTVELFAGTYHSQGEINGQGGASGGILLTPSGGGTTVRYDFTSTETDVTESPPSCSNQGVSCDCSRCSTYQSSGVRVWQKVTVSSLANGDYDVTTTTDHQIEWPWCSEGWSFTVTGSCPDGYMLDNSGNCVDIDECPTPNICNQNQECINEPGSYRCQCMPGFTGAQCTDIDECINDNDNDCATNNGAVCVNQQGSYTCECLSGRTGDPRVGCAHANCPGQAWTQNPCYDTGANSPCTPENIATGDMHYPSCTSPCHFIQCSEWGQVWDQICSAGLVWNDEAGPVGEGVCDYPPSSAAKAIGPLNDLGGNFKQINNIEPHYKNNYGYIMLIGVIAFILINNIFIGLWCFNKKSNKHVKFDMVGDDEEILNC